MVFKGFFRLNFKGFYGTILNGYTCRFFYFSTTFLISVENFKYKKKGIKKWP